MRHVVLKPFGHYPDGFTREALVPGDERDFGSATDGLLAAKMIGVKPEPSPVGYFVDEPTIDADASSEVATTIEEKPRKRRK